MRISLPQSYSDSDKIPKKIFNEGVYGFFKKRLIEIQEHYPQIHFIEQNRDKDHIHLLLQEILRNNIRFLKNAILARRVFGQTGILSVQ